MFNYLTRRLLLLPFTLFCIIMINFIIINLAPGDPVTVTEVSQEGMASRNADRSIAFGGDDRYLQFRERYGLTLPILFNFWSWTTQKTVDDDLKTIVNRKWNPQDTDEISVKDYDAFRVSFGDRSRYVMPKLLKTLQDDSTSLKIRIMASRFFIRGGTQQAFLGPQLTKEQTIANRKISIDNNLLRGLIIQKNDSTAEILNKVNRLSKWYSENVRVYRFEPSPSQKIEIVFFETRLYRYMSRILTFDFGTLRNDDDKTVVSEVTKRFKYSLTLSILPMLITFFLCQFFGFIMAYKHQNWEDHTLSLLFLILYALPIFVVAPFLIEKIALNNTFPFTNLPFPISGFTSPEAIYDKMNSYHRLFDIFTHILLPVIAIMYGSLAAQTRISRTAVLEVLRQDYIRTARAKGLSSSKILIKHVGRNAGITIVTSIASSLGVILGGSLIVETLFEIHGFGKFFYDAIINRDYNVIMFSSFAGSFLSLVGYLAADVAYTVLDPRVNLE